mmetsp:Transcript_70221/g.116677  ORF Transcript_70221/g.116677 Transcript_70221/m.116677 type:complete len:351 (-) Transcript_70221:299-1351(-)|eukprot:CAMPEP_0119320340 /NCGR_PEP_ID=MMETSP1333-20130426/52139_1 /TAXON_ID=418940 /ORGANISM="Scyphosphaera apsteinii, Strain RCC1455" /LENGTH=350 /DNA_ID=CAMNT_0007327037 /DNA_START=42 /DNA_END=1094 /DNA_ORIENTATION=-
MHDQAAEAASSSKAASAKPAATRSHLRVSAGSLRPSSPISHPNSQPKSPRPSSPQPQELSDQQYIEKHSIQLYLRDVVALLLQARHERPLEFIGEYFGEVLSGTHVLLREYEYINSCVRNRLDFVRSVRDAFVDFPPSQKVSGLEMAELMQLLCPDFPLELVAHACLLSGEKDDQIPFSELLHAVLARFYYADFLEKTAEVFCTCDTRACGQVNRNVLCLTLRQMLSTGRFPFNCPPAAVFDPILQGVPTSHADIKLLEMQGALIASPAMHRVICECGDPKGGSLVPSHTVVPPRARVSSSTTIDKLLDEMRAADMATGNGARRRSEKRAGSRRKPSSISTVGLSGSARA